MARQTSHPQKRARREAALERRRAQLEKGHGESTDAYGVKHSCVINKQAAEMEIANLERKLVGFSPSALKASLEEDSE